MSEESKRERAMEQYRQYRSNQGRSDRKQRNATIIAFASIIGIIIMLSIQLIYQTYFK
tara:strand:+ start:448 stop:621 length:174 start_codon:yes stop_codon:yes gene_type:complete